MIYILINPVITNRFGGNFMQPKSSAGVYGGLKQQEINYVQNCQHKEEEGERERDQIKYANILCWKHQISYMCFCVCA